MTRGRPKKTIQIEDAPVEVETVVEIDEKPQEPSEEEVKVEKKPEKEQISPENTSNTTENVEDLVISAIKGNNRPNGSPVIVRFNSGTGGFDKCVILYVNYMGLETAWNIYKSHSTHVSAEEFLGMIYKGLGMDIPRVYSTILDFWLN